MQFFIFYTGYFSRTLLEQSHESTLIILDKQHSPHTHWLSCCVINIINTKVNFQWTKPMILFSNCSEHKSKEIILDVECRHIAKIRLDSDSWQEYMFTHPKCITCEYSQICLECILPISTAASKLVC